MSNMFSSNKKFLYYSEKQKPPFTRPLRYQVQHDRSIAVDPGGNARRVYSLATSQLPPCGHLVSGYFPSSVKWARNEALRKFDSSVAQVADMMVAAVEARRNASSLVISPLRNLLRIAKAVRRRDPRIVRRVMRHYKGKESVREVIEKPSGLWLYYWFGIRPTVLDIQHALNLPDSGMYKTVRKRSGPWVDSYHNWPNRPGYYNTVGSYETSVSLRADVISDNSDLDLAARLGITSPLQAAWELVPWSWALDYVTNVGEVLSNFDGKYAGISLNNRAESVRILYSGAGENVGTADWERYTWSSNGTYLSRTTTLPTFSLEPPLKAISGQQASYLIAALSQTLKGIGTR